MDGLFLVTNTSVGCEQPVSEAFRREHGVAPKMVDEHDSRWTKHQAYYFTAFVRRVHNLVQEMSASNRRPLEIVVEGQGGFPGPNQDLHPESGLPSVPRWAFMPDFVDIETLARERLVDGLCFWTFRDARKLTPEARRKIKRLRSHST